MSTLLLRFAGPMQSWGNSSKFNTRGTGREPSKSAVVGLLAAALGRSRDEPVDDLASLRFGVRVDQEGTLVSDFQTAKSLKEKYPVVTSRDYLADAVFLIGLEGDDDLIRRLDDAVTSPVFPLFLGRRSCPPAGRVSLGIRYSGLEEALAKEPWQASDWYAKKMGFQVRLDVVMDDDTGEGPLQRDYPVSFSQVERVHVTRCVRYDTAGVLIENGRSRFRTTDHDPFQQLMR